ncbi:MAG: polymer-forming cytoskeletal protein [Pseudomonadota bacterium]
MEDSTRKRIVEKGASALKKIELELKSIDIDKEMDVISASSQFSGNFNFGKYTRIEGKITGKINSSGVLVVTETGDVNAEINGKSIIVDGKVKGNIIAERTIVIKENAVVEGELKAPNVVICHGAVINGSISMLKYYPKYKELLDQTN